MRDFLLEIQTELASGPSSIEFEMAYQARVAVDRIKFAIKHAEQFAPRTDQMREVELQLLDALERLQRVDRRFQERSRLETGKRCRTPQAPLSATNGTGSSTTPKH
jgi:hypothetical protein